MKTLSLFFAFFIAFIISSNSQEALQKEVYIMGTMHTVPNIVKHSYQPMLKNAINYQPDAIFVESPRAKDSMSWEYLKEGWSKNYQAFYKLSDSMKQHFSPYPKKMEQILAKDFSMMSKEDLDFAINSFAYRRDHANYEFYRYIIKHGIDGANKPTRNEDGDVTFKLALELEQKLLKSMDDQQTNGEYHKAWSQCSKEGITNGNNEINSKLNKKTYNSAILPALFRGLGKHTNKRSSLERLHRSSSFEYAAIKTPGCVDGNRYWNERNMRMAKNIAEQVIKSEAQKNIVIVGASHVIGLEKELKQNYPNLKVILMND